MYGKENDDFHPGYPLLDIQDTPENQQLKTLNRIANTLQSIFMCLDRLTELAEEANKNA